jgi:GLPGLI family protein
MSGDGDGIRYSNLATNESLVQKESFDKLFLITVDACNQKWEMKNESRKIGPFNCFKATTNKITRNSSGTFKKTVVAWYTTELPFPFGPIGYGRLPGLIVELTYENVVYCLKKIDLSPKTKLKIVKPFKGKHVSETEYEQWEQEAGKSITIDSFR